MPDVRCPKCGEPWDQECLHDETACRFTDLPWIDEVGNHDQKVYEEYFSKVRKDFAIRGCSALDTAYGGGCNIETIGPNNQIYGILMEFAGDDIDFASSMIEDAERYGLI